MSEKERPSTDFPIGWSITLVDAYMRDPRSVRVTKHPNPNHILAEDERGIVYYAHTGRIVGVAQAPVYDRKTPAVEFDLLGDPLPISEPSIEELLG